MAGGTKGGKGGITKRRLAEGTDGHGCEKAYLSKLKSDKYVQGNRMDRRISGNRKIRERR